eukprot:TRINITY_DN16199_c0_g1_i2.p1 TRINITY_DN16199_c0_g1~~TRINITY_DN16199_c0_g1_i2.p1  ORF type:complete len:223 (+),score=32.69 TRINITY_DN16199_c0_g1_i2:26-694(+)
MHPTELSSAMGQASESSPAVARQALLEALAKSEHAVLRMDLADTAEFDMIQGHVYCRIKCSITIAGTPLHDWRIMRRLGHLRDKLHDVVKASLGMDAYIRNFHPDANFAHRGGFQVPNNGRRVQVWLSRLSELCNSGKIDTKIVQHVLDYVMEPSFSPLELSMMKHEPWCEQLPLPDPRGIDGARFPRRDDISIDTSVLRVKEAASAGYSSGSDMPPWAGSP